MPSAEDGRGRPGVSCVRQLTRNDQRRLTLTKLLMSYGETFLSGPRRSLLPRLSSVLCLGDGFRAVGGEGRGERKQTGDKYLGMGMSSMACEVATGLATGDCELG